MIATWLCIESNMYYCDGHKHEHVDAHYRGRPHHHKRIKLWRYGKEDKENRKRLIEKWIEMENESKQKERVDYEPISIFEGTELLTDMMAGKTFAIEGIEFGEAGFGEYALVKVAELETKLRTSSKVLVPQLKEIDVLIKQNKEVNVTLKKVKDYYTF